MITTSQNFGSLCSVSAELQRGCNRVLQNASLKLPDITLQSFQLKVKEISKEQDSLCNEIKAEVSATEFTNIQNYVSQKIENLSREIRYRYEMIYKRDNVYTAESN